MDREKSRLESKIRDLENKRTARVTRNTSVQTQIGITMKITRGQRVGIFVSVVWLLFAALFFSMTAAGIRGSSVYEFTLAGETYEFYPVRNRPAVIATILGSVAPVIIGWGIWWIRRE